LFVPAAKTALQEKILSSTTKFHYIYLHKHKVKGEAKEDVEVYKNLFLKKNSRKEERG